MITKLTNSGQITLPIDIRNGLRINEDRDLYFHIDPIKPIVWISTNEISNYSSKLSSKGQISIPRQIRNKFSLVAGVQLQFFINGNQVYFEVYSEKVPCDVCSETGLVGNLPCLVCLGEGWYKKEPVMNILSRLMARPERQVGIELNTVNQVIPVIKFISATYPLELLKRYQDFYQWLFFKEYAVRGILNSNIIDLFSTSEYKTLVEQQMKLIK
jgi:bifunctional DNA-binding transcriptional regulator/antitoxin component of YhaV-PrlF toxin-antitoxin module